MTGPRIPHTRAGVKLTGGNDQPTTPCAEGYERWNAARLAAKEHADETGVPLRPVPWVFDALIDNRAPDVFAVREAREMCGRCPIAATCLPTARANGERWALAVIGKDKKAPVARDTCGTMAGAQTHSRHREYHCEPCKAAMRAKWHARKKAAA